MWILREPNKDGGREFSHLTDAYRAFLFWRDECEITCEFYYRDPEIDAEFDRNLNGYILADIREILFSGRNAP